MVVWGLGGAVIGLSVGGVGAQAHLRRRLRRYEETGVALANAFCATFKTDPPGIDRPIATRLASMGWSVGDIQRLAPLADEESTTRPYEITTRFLVVGSKQWPGRKPREQADWMLAFGNADLGYSRSQPIEQAAPYIEAFGHDLAPLAFAAGLRPADQKSLSDGTLDRATLVMMAALRGRSGFDR